MQLGGYEEENAQGYENGVRFYEKPIETTGDGKDWAIPVSSLLIAKEKNEKWETFHIPHSGFTSKLTIQSQFVILPYSLKEDLETSF